MSDSQIHTGRDCMETGSGCSPKGKVVALKKSAPTAGFGKQLHYCVDRNGASTNALGKFVFLVNLKNGELERCVQDHALGVLKPGPLPGEEEPQPSQIRPSGTLPLECYEPQHSGFSFLEDGGYTTGVRLCSEKEAVEYVEMQKFCQYRTMLCDRNDSCV